MKKIFIIFIFAFLYVNAHPVSYTINLIAKYNEQKKEANIFCSSNSRNKCGLYSFHLIDENENILLTKRFPFLKKETKVKIERKPYKMIFFLRKVPEHTYIKVFE